MGNSKQSRHDTSHGRYTLDTTPNTLPRNKNSPLAVSAEQGCVRVHTVHKAQQREYNEYNEQQALIAIAVCTSTLHECVG